MKINRIRKFYTVLLLMILSAFLLTGCGNSGSNGGNIINNSGEGYVEGYVYQTSDGEYVFDKEKGETPVENAQIELDGQIYNTKSNGYFKSGSLDPAFEHTINVVIPKENDTDFVWSSTFNIKDKETLNLATLSIKKEWNIVLFMSDKSTSLDVVVSHFMDGLDTYNNMENANLFIIHGKYLIEYEEDENGDWVETSSEETNKAYYLTGNGKKEVYDYGNQNFGDHMFYREELQKINERYPADKTMISIFSHGSGWSYFEEPGKKKNAISADHGYADRMEAEGKKDVQDFALEMHEVYDLFHNIGFDVDILNFAACHMGQVEVIDNLSSNIKYAMASPSFGYTADLYVHTKLLKDINNGGLSSEELGRKYIDYYVERLNGHDKIYPSVKALYDMRKYKPFVDSFAVFSSELYTFFNNNPESLNHYREDVLNTNSTTIQSYYDSGGALEPDLVNEKDLLGLLDYLRNNPKKYSERISSSAGNLYNLLDDVLVYSNNSEGSETLLLYEDNGKTVDKNQEIFTYKNSNGLSIFVEDYLSYESLWFNQATDWYKVIELTDDTF
jgi:hypothetical protein